jgi:hypothetical protein
MILGRDIGPLLRLAQILAIALIDRCKPGV